MRLTAGGVVGAYAALAIFLVPEPMRLLGCTLPVLLLAALFVRTAGRLGGETSRAPIVVFALLFGTPLFAGGFRLFPGALEALALFGAWAALFVPGGPRDTGAREIAAGALLGLAVLWEHPALIPALIVVAAAAWKRDPRRLARVTLGAAPFAAFLLWNRISFEGFFEPAFARVLLGLLAFSPFLILWPRAFSLAGRVLSRPAAAALGLVPAAFLFFGGWPDGRAPSTAGPQCLVAVLPFLVFPFFFRGGGRLEAALLGASVLSVAARTLASPD